MLWTDKANKILQKYWGDIKGLKDKQFETINELLLGNDVIGLLPTGYGKSLCYLIPPLITKKTMFIISPLISLMEDQIEKLKQVGIRCSALHSNNLNKEEEIEQIIKGKIKIVYMSPEYLINGSGLSLAETLIKSNKMGYMAIDESHCVSGWGHDFRPEYIKLKIFRELFSDIPILAVTATATTQVCQDISKNLLLNNPVTVRASFDRPNLYIKIAEPPTMPVGKKEKSIPREQAVLPYIKKYPNDKIIIYTNSRDSTVELSDALNKINKGCSAAYHAGLTNKVRDSVQTKFSEGEIKIIVSTIAFGMGIDQIVRCVIVFGSPSSIEEFYQQIGRGGRDGLYCDAILYFEYSKLVIGKYMLKDIRFSNPVLYKIKMGKLDQISKMVYMNTCRRKFILEYLNEKCDFFTCDNCDNCKEQKLTDMTNEFWPIIMKKNTSISGCSNEIKNKYLVSINTTYKKKDKTIELDLMDTLWDWKNHIEENKIKKEDLSEKLKLKIPTKFIKVISNEPIKEEIDDKIEKYEKMFKNLL